MSDPSSQPVSPSPAAASPLLMVGGILFIGVWIAVHLIWASMSLLGTLMANDSGAASTDRHGLLILGMLVGQLLAGGAGIPGGLAFFWRSRRKTLWILFAVLFLAGCLCQVAAFYSFFSSAGTHS